MLKIAAIAFMPTVSVTFGILAVLILSFPSVTSDYAMGASLMYGAAVVSALLAVPFAWFVARRMVLRRERRMIDATRSQPAL